MRSRLLAAGITVFLLFTSLVSAAFAQGRADPAARKLATAKPSIACPSRSAPAASWLSPDRAAGPAACSNLIVDGGFEGGAPNPSWDPETSTNFGTPVCNASCGTGNGTAGAFAGSFWAWFGGTASPENATLGQTVTIPTGTASLTFQMWIGAVSSPFTDTLTVKVDGVTLQTYPEPSSAETNYTLRTIDVSAYANGGSHAILFEHVGPGGGVANFSVDDVALSACTPTAVTVASTAARRTSRGVSVRWTTGSERGLLGFRVYRQDGSKRVRVNSKLLRGYGTFTGSRYSLVDRLAPRGRALRYWIEAVHVDGSKTWHGPAVVSS